VGDWLLKQVAEILRKYTRDEDTVARLGGDEFILLLPEITRIEDAARVAQKILEVIAVPLSYESHDLYITTSIGMSMSPSDGQDAETLIKSADNAMYRAKELGRNNYQFWSPALNVRAHERLTWERNIRRAIDRSEFVLHYQPQVFLDSGVISGVEALIRWNNPEKGIVAPMDFIPLAEESRLILPIGEWILYTACRQLKTWHEEGCNRLRLSLNLSGRQFQHQNLIDLLERVIEDTSIDPKLVLLEITETVAMQNVEYTLSILRALKERGFQIALDDFGIGYSSLSYLKHFPIDIIKIDPSFVKDVGKGLQEEALVRSIIHLGHSMKRTIIAEGVETELQHTFLRFEGCEEVQGYLLCRPHAPDDLKPVLLRGRV
jgi:EAL domain-containing protein (putative c-di-GMP-specific phosphodiesterase class I)